MGVNLRRGGRELRAICNSGAQRPDEERKRRLTAASAPSSSDGLSCSRTEGRDSAQRSTADRFLDFLLPIENILLNKPIVVVDSRIESLIPEIHTRGELNVIMSVRS